MIDIATPERTPPLSCLCPLRFRYYEVLPTIPPLKRDTCVPGLLNVLLLLQSSSRIPPSLSVYLPFDGTFSWIDFAEAVSPMRPYCQFFFFCSVFFQDAFKVVRSKPPPSQPEVSFGIFFSSYFFELDTFLPSTLPFVIS